MVPPPLIRRLRLTALLLGLVLSALAWRVWTSAGASLRPVDREGLRSVPFADVYPYGAAFFLEREVEPWKRRQTVEMAAGAGLRWVHQHFPWADIEPEPKRFSWAKYDELVDLYRQHGLEVIARLDWPPAWVEPAPWVAEDLRGTINAPPADAEVFADFVAATVSHFRGRVRFFQIWNEPNLVAEWGANPAHPVDPAEYRALLAAAAAAARRANPDAVILAAPLAPNAESPDFRGNMSDLAYLDGMYRAGAAEDFDVLAAIALGMDRAPADEPSPTAINFRRAELQREVMVRHGDAGTAIWFTHVGWNAAPADLESPWGQVSEPDQARFTTEALGRADMEWPWAGVFCIWYFRQWGQYTPDDPAFYFRMVDVQFGPRLLYEAVRAVGEPTAGPGLWAERSAPVTLPDLDAWRWHWAEEAEGRNALTAARRGASLTFDLEGEGLAARFLAGPGAGTVKVVVDTDGVTNGIEQLVQVPDDQEGWYWLPLAGTLVRGRHRVQLTVVGDGWVTLDAFEVARATGWGAVDGLGLVLGVLAAGMVVVLALDTRNVARCLRW